MGVEQIWIAVVLGAGFALGLYLAIYRPQGRDPWLIRVAQGWGRLRAEARRISAEKAEDRTRDRP